MTHGEKDNVEQSFLEAMRDYDDTMALEFEDEESEVDYVDYVFDDED